MKRKSLIVLAGILLVSMLFVGCGGKKEADVVQDKTRIAFVSYQALDSSEWLQNLVVGLKNYEAKNSNVEIKCIEALSVDQYEPKVMACCENGFDIIITAYSDMAPATIKAAKKYPNIKFGILQGEIENIQDYKNISDFHLNRTETAFVQGCVTGLMTKTGKVGFVGGVDAGGINEILAGYQQGIQYVNPSVVDYVTYCNSFTDPTIGKDYAQQLIAKGCDIVFGAAGGSSTGCAQAMEENGLMYAACDVHYPEVAPKGEIGSALNFFENMVLAFIDDTLSGNYRGGESHEYGIGQGAAKYEFANNNLVPKEIQDRVNDISKQVGEGKIKVSATPLHK